MIKLEKCPICKEENFKSLEYLRNQMYWYDQDLREKGEPVTFKICKSCGFVTYDYLELDRLQAHYEKERPVMTAKHFLPANRKNEYHKKFLEDVDESFIDKSAEFPILDVGCAQGAFLKMLAVKYEFEDSIEADRMRLNGIGSPSVDVFDLHGTEWSTAFRNYGRYEYGLRITKEIDESMEYGFISYYHVMEHIQDPDKEIKKVHDLLEDDGLLYVATPQWFNACEEDSGAGTDNFEHYYHLNHVNVFSKNSLKNLLQQNGFEIIKENYVLYGLTFLCKKTDKKFDLLLDDYKEIVSTLTAEKDAIQKASEGKWQEAMDIMPKYPDMYINITMGKDFMKDFKKQLDMLEKGLEICGQDCLRIKMQIGRLLFQWDETKPETAGFYSNNIKRAEEIWNEILERKPGVEDAHYFLAFIEGKYKKNYDKAVEHLYEYVRINPFKYQEGHNLIAHFWKEKGEKDGN